MAVERQLWFEAISGALYGLKIESKGHFMELLNQGAINKVKPEISLQITFVGKVLGQQQKYILKRIYQLNPQGLPLESVSLNMNGNMYVYGTMTAPKERVRAEQEISKIIKANLPQELSQYFLFDAMQSSELLKKNVFQRPSVTILRTYSDSRSTSNSNGHRRNYSKNGHSSDWKPNRKPRNTTICVAKKKISWLKRTLALPSRTGCTNIWHL